MKIRIFVLKRNTSGSVRQDPAFCCNFCYGSRVRPGDRAVWIIRTKGMQAKTLVRVETKTDLRRIYIEALFDMLSNEEDILL